MENIKSRINILLRERAQWLFSNMFLTKPIWFFLGKILNYNLTVNLAEQIKDMNSSELLEFISGYLNCRITTEGLENLPKNGAALCVCNHPTGITDGLVVWSIVSKVRSDTFIFANGDIIRLFPQTQDIIAPIEWIETKRTLSSSRKTLNFIKLAFKEKRIGIIFPAGRIARRQGFKIKEGKWFVSALKLAAKNKVPVIPIKIEARNSLLYYLLDLIHFTLRDISLFNEVLNKRRADYKVNILKLINTKCLSKDHAKETKIIFNQIIGVGNNPDNIPPCKHRQCNNEAHLQKHTRHVNPPR